MTLPAARAFLALLLVPSAARADVLVVDVLGGGDFTQINQAMAAAQDGDTILVRTGNYGPFVNAGRDADVVAEEGAWVHVNGYIGVVGLAAHQDVVLSGLRSFGTEPNHFGLFLADNAGSVRVQDGHFTGYSGAHDPGCFAEDGTDGIRVEDCADVAFVRCTALGGRGGNDGTATFVCPGLGPAAGHGIDLRDSLVSAIDCEFTGGRGGDGGFGGKGGVGCIARGGELFLSGSTATGGRSGDGNDSIVACIAGGAGLAVHREAQVRVLDCEFVGGESGYAGELSCPGPPTSGSFDSLSGSARHFHAARLVDAGAPASLALEGEPGEAVWLLLSRQPEQSLDLALAGTWLIRTPALTTVAPLGTLDAEGRLEVEWPASAVGDVTTWHLQALFVGAGGQRLAGARQVHVFPPGR